MTTPTTIFELEKPTVGGSADTWGTEINVVVDSVDKLLSVITTGGSGAAYTLTSGQSLAAYAAGQVFRIKASFTCNAAATINIDSLGAKNLTKNGTTATVSGDIVSGSIYTIAYDGTQFQIVAGPIAGGFQPLDSDLTAIAALTTAAAGRQLLTIADPNADKIYFWDDSAGDWAALTLPSCASISGTSLLIDETWPVACSDESTALTSGTGKASFVFPYNVTVVTVGASVNTAGTALTIDINESGTSILSTKLTIDSGEKTSLTAATPAVISDASITAGNEITIDFDTVTGTWKGCKVWLIVRRTS